jgi:hypothetical protein
MGQQIEQITSASPELAERDEPAGSPVAEAPASDSVLAQFQRAMASGVAPRPAPPPRPSRREQTAKIAEQPFVKRAMDLFEASPDKMRYTPPDEEKP